ncbi:hypothetical protein MK805_00755 [Shimazuella sp. AN120528]|uniref:hypothetical protein n=1 Tax=Shimazuella soli TaxID=1892854 RepID=UPI001F113BCC|nr:hypothetical protein [Shimazuella soli]MCH5583500.1 hypothetical protein [Shimazuella soli]
MKRKSGKWIGFVLAVSLTLTAVGCSTDASSEKITVKDNNDVSYNQVMMQKIDKYKDVSAIKWLNNDKVFTNGNNDLNRYDLKTKQTEPIYKFNYKYSKITLSPDKKHAFVEVNNSDDAINIFHYMMNVDTKRLIPVPFATNGNFVSDCSWSDNENLVFTDKYGKIYKVNISGKIEKIKHSITYLEDFEQKFEIQQVKDQFFYLDQEKLFVWNQKTNKTKMLMNPVDNFTISPDKTKIAVEKIIPVDPNETYEGKDNTKTKENLVVMDLSGKIQSVVDEGSDIEGVGWSPDSKKLAYADGQNASTELYISDVIKPQPKLVAVNILGLFADYDPIKWSPSGNKLLINGYSDPVKGPDYGTSVLYIITLGQHT